MKKEPKNNISSYLCVKLFARECHKYQTRKDNKTPYITHPERVARAVLQHPEGTVTMAKAAWLHDVMEDCEIPFETISEKFGNDVARLVNWLTNRKYPEGTGRSVKKSWDRYRLSKAPREAKIIKLLDRIDNLRDTKGMTEAFKKLYANESLLLAEVLKDADLELYKKLVGLAKELKEEACLSR